MLQLKNQTACSSLSISSISTKLFLHTSALHVKKKRVHVFFLLQSTCKNEMDLLNTLIDSVMLTNTVSVCYIKACRY